MKFADFFAKRGTRTDAAVQVAHATGEVLVDVVLDTISSDGEFEMCARGANRVY